MSSITTSQQVKYINKQWLLNKHGNHKNYKPLKEQLMNELKINDILATLLLNRGIKTADEAIKFLYGTLDDLHSPFLLMDMEKAVERTKKAIEGNEMIAFFTDFDCDGTTANAIFGLAFKKILKYENIVLYIPHRKKEGYGLNCPALKNLQDQGCSLVISADIGITAYKEADYCKEIGLDLIITDHHLPKLPEDYDPNDPDQFKYLPQSYALVNPNRPDDNYPFKGICGAFVAFKFLQALWTVLGRDPKELDVLIPIVATAVVADIVPLKDENRIIVKEGLRMMNREGMTGIPGFDEIMKSTGYKQFDADSIAFGIAPRINTCGRLEHAKMASELILSEDEDFSRERAKEINNLNEERKKYQNEVIEKAFEAITEDYLSNNTAVCLYVPKVHAGVVGIAASQVVEKVFRPTIIVTDHPEMEGYLVGSARSIPSLHLLNILMDCKDAFNPNDEKEKFGGHSQAAGLTIHKDNFPKLQEALRKYFIVHPVSKEELMPKLVLDKALRITDVNGKLMEDIDFLAPYGAENPSVKFGFKNVPSVIKFYKNDTLGFILPSANGQSLRGSGFRMHDKAKDLGLQESVSANLDLAFVPKWNEYGGHKSIQVGVEDFRRS